MNERLAALTAAGHERLARPDPAQPDRERRAERLAREDSLRGVTSNPAIFEKAILGSDDYDEQIARARRPRASTRADLRGDRDHRRAAACDVLRPVWDEAGGADGFVSLEVEPGFAHDTEPRSPRRATSGSASTGRT